MQIVPFLGGELVDSLRSAGKLDKLFDLAGGGNKQHDEVSKIHDDNIQHQEGGWLGTCICWESTPNLYEILQRFEFYSYQRSVFLAKFNSDLEFI